MIKNLKPAASKYIRSEGNGFTIRFMPSGVKTCLYASAAEFLTVFDRAPDVAINALHKAA